MRLWFLCVVFAVGFVGCGADEPPPPQYAHHIQKIFHVWLVYTMHNGNKDPADAEALKAWAMATKDEAEVAELYRKMNITDVEDAFTSPRDGQPYVFARLDLAKRDFDRTVAYEQNGVGGKHFIVTETGRAEEIEESELHNALKKNGKGQ